MHRCTAHAASAATAQVKSTGCPLSASLALACAPVGAAVTCVRSIKWTALVTPVLVTLESLVAVWFAVRPMPWGVIWKSVVVGLAQYTTWFYIHFALLPKSGMGDLFMPKEFQKTLIGSAVYNVRGPRPRPLPPPPAPAPGAASARAWRALRPAPLARLSF